MWTSRARCDQMGGVIVGEQDTLKRCARDRLSPRQCAATLKYRVPNLKDPRKVTAVQTALTTLGHYYGHIDGIAGPGTVAAITRWRRNTRFAGGTKLTDQMIFEMKRQAEAVVSDRKAKQLAEARRTRETKAAEENAAREAKTAQARAETERRRQTAELAERKHKERVARAAAAERKRKAELAARNRRPQLQKASHALKQKRVALVIGNDGYQSLPGLNNAVTDARGMAAKLRGLGFDVILMVDVGRRAFYRAIAAFEQHLSQADVGLVFYAGHGIQAGGRNYLIPANAQIEDEADLPLDGVEAGRILAAMKRAGSRLNIIIMDACRDNPLPSRSRSTSRGLSVTAVPAGLSGTAMVYSAAPGQTAQDGPKGSHGIFTGELLQVLDQPGLKLEDVFKKTARRVAALTHGKQDPWINSSVKGDFIFRPAALAAATPKYAPGNAPKSARRTGSGSAELLFWESIKDSTNPALFQAYLEQYPNGPFAPLARLKISETPTEKVAALPPPSFTVEEMDETMVVLKSANVRASPTTKAEKVGRLRQGADVDVTGTTTVDGRPWWRITHAGGKLAFVWGPLLGRPAEKAPAPLKRPAVGIYSERQPGDSFKDCPDCPEMVVLPPGSFRMGDLNGGLNAMARPVHDVRINHTMAAGKFEISRIEYFTFVTSANHEPKKGCYVQSYGRVKLDPDKNWLEPGLGQTETHPAVCVSWHDADKYVAWLSQRTGHSYRLLTEAEWEYAARAGSTTKYSFGNDEDQLCDHGNGFDIVARGNSSISANVDCQDKFAYTAPVGSYRANKFGLHDMHGNVSEWVSDCNHANYQGAPANGSAWTDAGGCGRHILRGGSFSVSALYIRAAARTSIPPTIRMRGLGFRIARTLSK
ncbi:MAG: SUMF1/EgtB/PvdO family nonheme iron enzyme [Rhodospirillaceae bacterium]|nr:SUMF1/EgtB/PvdO family nonheme iron enzyme [Rhodospirillaceae bacterium]